MPKKRISAKRATNPISSFDFEDVDFLTQVDRLAFEGFYDVEIADKLNISRWQFDEAKRRSKKLTSTLENARERARAKGADIPSPALFAEVWKTCDGKRSKLMKKFGIGWTKFQQWCREEPAFIDIMAERDLEFLEQADIAGRILSLGGIKDKDQFPGWSRHPDPWMMRFYMNTLGKRYGYGENPVIEDIEDDTEVVGNVEQGINVADWIKLEMTQKKNKDEAEKGGNAE